MPHRETVKPCPTFGERWARLADRGSLPMPSLHTMRALELGLLIEQIPPADTVAPKVWESVDHADSFVWSQIWLSRCPCWSHRAHAWIARTAASISKRPTSHTSPHAKHSHPVAVTDSAGCRTTSPAVSGRYTVRVPHSGHAPTTCQCPAGVRMSRAFFTHPSIVSATTTMSGVSSGR